jgi:hypothetical protein
LYNMLWGKKCVRGLVDRVAWGWLGLVIFIYVFHFLHFLYLFFIFFHFLYPNNGYKTKQSKKEINKLGQEKIK